MITGAIQELCNGEIMEITRPETSEAGYLQRVGKKTAALLVAALEGGGRLGGLSPEALQQVRDFGKHLGIAFQIVDDLLDLVGETDALGKPCWQDLRQGIITLPVLHFLRVSAVAPSWRDKLRAGGLSPSEVSVLLSLLEESGSMAYTAGVARQHLELARQALEHLPALPPREEMYRITEEIMVPLDSLRPLH